MTTKLQDDCFRPGAPRLTHAEAIAHLKCIARPIAGIEVRPIAAALGRLTAETVTAGWPVPLHTNAAVDGYAFAASSYDRAAGTSFSVVARAAAGHPVSEAVPPGSAARIFTGAVMPAATDTVVMQEDVSFAAGDGAASPTVRVPPGLKPGANVRKAGEDVAAGTVLLGPGHVIRPQDIAAMASIGRADVTVAAPLRVAIVSSGDEVVHVGTGALRPGQVYDANAPMLAALAAVSGATVEDHGVLPDCSDTVRTRLHEIASGADLVLTSGGASGGEEDHFGAALAALGSRHFWQLAVKPGRPMMLGQIDGTPVVGLPGNPVAVFVCYLMYVHPLIRALAGAPWPEPRRFRYPAAFEFTGRKPGRREFWRGSLQASVEGQGWSVAKFKRDGSGLISGLRAADGLIDIAEAHGDVHRGDLVDFIPFSEFGF